MSTFIIDNQYFGCINYYKKIVTASTLAILPYDPFQKASFRNRCVVAGSNGLINLSVPVELGRNTRQPMKEVKISYRDHWQLIHLRTLISCYAKAPFFEFYQGWLENFYHKKFTFLLDMNLEILEWTQKMLKLHAAVSLWENGSFEESGADLDCRNHWLPKNFQAENGQVKYVQVFEDRIGFQPNLSILDLLFCTGPDAKKLLIGQQ